MIRDEDNIALMQQSKAREKGFETEDCQCCGDGGLGANHKTILSNAHKTTPL